MRLYYHRIQCQPHSLKLFHPWIHHWIFLGLLVYLGRNKAANLPGKMWSWLECCETPVSYLYSLSTSRFRLEGNGERPRSSTKKASGAIYVNNRKLVLEERYTGNQFGEERIIYTILLHYYLLHSYDVLRKYVLDNFRYHTSRYHVGEVAFFMVILLSFDLNEWLRVKAGERGTNTQGIVSLSISLATAMTAISHITLKIYLDFIMNYSYLELDSLLDVKQSYKVMMHLILLTTSMGLFFAFTYVSSTHSSSPGSTMNESAYHDLVTTADECVFAYICVHTVVLVLWFLYTQNCVRRVTSLNYHDKFVADDGPKFLHFLRKERVALSSAVKFRRCDSKEHFGKDDWTMSISVDGRKDLLNAKAVLIFAGSGDKGGSALTALREELRKIDLYKTKVKKEERIIRLAVPLKEFRYKVVEKLAPKKQKPTDSFDGVLFAKVFGSGEEVEKV